MAKRGVDLACIFWHVTLIYNDKMKRQQCKRRKRLDTRPQEALLCAKAKRTMFYLCESEATATMFYLCESEATATKQVARNETPPHLRRHNIHKDFPGHFVFQHYEA
ncbi:hypothetical protein [Lysinibacillus sp. FJAT-14222]|uniref:hypothetical protein n=1 Tax=Lysinibacillus sp. FJAT-14222 TaxID=1932366 RepID=UPI0006ADF896|nr:hypothetical protein [Lysinibacillus sp. FJAT-14222]KOS61159.1 hypothetical protein AN161_19460 [Lysinibacillus sp. FJAT-14222]